MRFSANGLTGISATDFVVSPAGTASVPKIPARSASTKESSENTKEKFKNNNDYEKDNV